MPETDDDFYDRADAHIHLSNSQVTENTTPGRVSSSFMYSVARYNAFISAKKAKDGKVLHESIESIVDYFLEQYEAMLRENLEDYVENFDTYFNLNQ